MWHYPPDLPIINADKKNLLRILQNLVDNAIKFTSEGEVSISARTNPENDSVKFVLADTGSRIAEEDRAAILREVSTARQFRNEGVRRAWSGPVYRQEICSANGRGIVVASGIGPWFDAYRYPSYCQRPRTPGHRFEYTVARSGPMELTRDKGSSSGLNEGDHRKCLLAEGILSLQKQ